MVNGARTFSSAYFPPTIAAEMIGSVGVKQLAIARHATKPRIGKRTLIKAATMIQPMAMVRTIMTRRDLTCLYMKLPGNWAPMMNKPLVSVIRVTSSVIVVNVE